MIWNISRADYAAILTETLISSGRVPDVTVVNKFGFNPDVDSATVPEDIWPLGGIFSGFPTGVAEAVEVFSSSADDTLLGVGARSIRITGLDANFVEQSETLNLNGVTPVTSSLVWSRIHTANVRSAGSSNFNVGSITCRHVTTTANVFFGMLPNRNQTNTAAYTVPAGKTAYMIHFNAYVRDSSPSPSTNTCDVALWTRESGMAPRLRRPYSFSGDGGANDHIHGGLRLPERTDIIPRVLYVSGNDTVVTCNYDLILMDD